jgi:hypothetical protein
VPLQRRESLRQRQNVTARKTWILGNTAVIRSNPATSFATANVGNHTKNSFSIQHFWIRLLSTSTSSCISDDGQFNRNTFAYTMKALHSKDQHHLCWFKAQIMETGTTATVTFALGTRRRWEVSFTSHPAPWGTWPHTHFVGDWVDPKLLPDRTEKRKFLASTGNRTTIPCLYSSSSHYINYAKPVHRTSSQIQMR